MRTVWKCWNQKGLCITLSKQSQRQTQPLKMRSASAETKRTKHHVQTFLLSCTVAASTYSLHKLAFGSDTLRHDISSVVFTDEPLVYLYHPHCSHWDNRHYCSRVAHNHNIYNPKTWHSWCLTELKEWSVKLQAVKEKAHACAKLFYEGLLLV